jgi:uncharacterized protein YndB with AHSA1/START domain
MEINKDASAVSHAEIDIAAPPELVWAVLTDIDNWPSWNPEVKGASLAGPLAPGAQFRWKAGPGTITSTLESVEPPKVIAWTGKTFGIKAVHLYRLDPRGDTTIVKSDESWDGLVVRLFRGPMTKTLQKSTESGLRHLKTEAERRAAKTTASSEGAST